MMSIRAHITLSLFMSVNLNEFTIYVLLRTSFLSPPPYSHMHIFLQCPGDNLAPFMIAPQYQYVSQFCLLVGSIYRLAFFWQWRRGHKSFKWMSSLINPGTARINLSTILKRTHCCTFTTVWQNAWQFILVEERWFLFHNFWKFQSNTGEGTVWFRATEAI